MINKDWQLTLAERAEISLKHKETTLEAIAFVAQRKLMEYLNKLYPNKAEEWKQICRDLGVNIKKEKCW